MTVSLILEEAEALRPHITVFGVGAAGENAVNRMITSGNFTHINFVIINTGAPLATQSQASERIQLGRNTTAAEIFAKIVKRLELIHICFIVADMEDRISTNVAPMIARAAKEMNVLTAGIVMEPFEFKSDNPKNPTLQKIEDLRKNSDTLIVIPGQGNAFAQGDQFSDQVYSGVRGVTDMLFFPGLIYLDFADMRSIFSRPGKAMMGSGEGEGNQRANLATEAAISQLNDNLPFKNASAVLINITGGDDLNLFDVDEATTRIRNDADPEANIIFGAVFDNTMNGKVRVSVVATGIIDGKKPDDGLLGRSGFKLADTLLEQ